MNESLPFTAMTRAEFTHFLQAHHERLVEKEGSTLTGDFAILLSPALLKPFFQNPTDDEILQLFEILHPCPQGSSESEISIEDIKAFDSYQVTSFLSNFFCRPRGLHLNLESTFPDGKALMEFNETFLDNYSTASSKHGAKELHKYLAGLKGRDHLGPSASDIAVWSKAFTVKYKDPANMVANFVSYIQKCSHSFSLHPAKYFSPYISLV